MKNGWFLHSQSVYRLIRKSFTFTVTLCIQFILKVYYNQWYGIMKVRIIKKTESGISSSRSWYIPGDIYRCFSLPTLLFKKNLRTKMFWTWWQKPMFTKSKHRFFSETEPEFLREWTHSDPWAFIDNEFGLLLFLPILNFAHV